MIKSWGLAAFQIFVRNSVNSIDWSAPVFAENLQNSAKGPVQWKKTKSWQPSMCQDKRNNTKKNHGNSGDKKKCFQFCIFMNGAYD